MIHGHLRELYNTVQVVHNARVVKTPYQHAAQINQIFGKFGALAFFRGRFNSLDSSVEIIIR